MSSQRSGPVVVGVAVLASLGLVAVMAYAVAGSLGSGAPEARPSPSKPAPPSPRPSPSPTPTPRPKPTDPLRGRSPYTGLPMKSAAPVLAVKIDNHRRARPHTNIDQADIVYIEPVEAGLSRLLAIYSSRLPESIGPVRSARESDLGLLRQFGTPAFAYSGSNAIVDQLVSNARVFNLSHERVDDPYFRSGERSAPHNLYARPEELLKLAPKASVAKDIGFRFGPAPTDGRPIEAREVRLRSFRIEFFWSGKEQRWLIDMDGRHYFGADRKSRPGPQTVVIQEVEVRDSEYDALRERGSPYVETVGSGRATVLRDGMSFNATWHRPSLDAGTTFETADGQPMPFAPGQVWVVLRERP